MKKSLFLVPTLFILVAANMNVVNAESPNNGGGFIEKGTNDIKNSLSSGIEINVEPDVEPDVDPDADTDGSGSTTPSCSKNFYHPVSTVTMQVAKTFGDYRALSWGFNLTKPTQRALGPTVNVTMPVATINQTPINPPYQLHSREVTYNFHGSLKNYSDMGGSKTLKKGDVVNFNWLITKFTNPSEGAYRYIRCKVN